MTAPPVIPEVPLLPAGFGLRPDRDLRVLDGGRVLVGGAPLRILRLSGSGTRVVQALFEGAEVGPGPQRAALARRLVTLGLAHPDPPPGAGVDAGPTAEALTVVIPVRDDATGLARTLAALRAGGGGRGEVRIIVVDDGSTGADAVAAEGAARRADVVRRAVAGGPGVARAEGLAWVATPLVAFVDAGVEPGPATLDRLLDHLADPAVVAVAPRIASPPGPGTVARYEQANSPLDLGARPAPVRPGSWVPYVPTTCLVARVGAVRAAGGFDPELRYGEDVDLVWRLVGAGGAVRYQPEVSAIHPPRPTLGALLLQRVRYGSAAGALARRHGDLVAPTRCSGWSLAVWGLVAAGHPLAGLGLAAWTARALRPQLTALPHPGREAVRLTLAGHGWAGRNLAHQLVRTWWPLTAVAALHPRGRRLALAGVAASVASRWAPPQARDDRAPAGGRRLETAALGLLDDLAYGAGVWWGLGRGTARAVLPGLVAWPGRDDVPAPDVTGR